MNNRLLHLDEVADVLQVPMRQVIELIGQDKLRAMRIGRRHMRVHPLDLVAFIETLRNESSSSGKLLSVPTDDAAE